MNAPPRVLDHAASLLETDPTLAHTLGPKAAAELGHEPILPVLAVASGPWEPPARQALGGGTVALVVLDGLLVAAASPPALIGPEDVLEPWDTADGWIACTSLRLALIGTCFMEALQGWPSTVAHLLARARARPATARAGGTVDDRVLALLWRIGGRWGTPAGDWLALPDGVDTRVVAMLLELSEPDIAAAVAALVARGKLVGDGHWQLATPAVTFTPGGHSRERRDDLRARGARQLAISRHIRAEYASVSEQVELARQRRGP